MFNEKNIIEMREIKFRAINKNGGSMKDHQEVCRILYNASCSTFSAIEAYNIMQYTGLNDKNGVEIYEGDIVKINDNWNNENKSVTAYCTYEVKANLIGGLCFSCLEISEENKRVYRREIGDDAELGNWMYKHLEVIGNIYEEQK